MAESGQTFLTTQKNEFIKQYCEYDLADRLEFLYTAPASARHGDPCTLTTYEYVNPTTGRISKRRESQASWDSSWDI